MTTKNITTAGSVTIYAYDDFRVFLKDQYEAMKLIDPAISTRSFAVAAGFTNPGFLNDVIKGRRSLSIEARKKIATVFRLSESEADYFNMIVEYGQTKREVIRQKLYKEIISRRNRSTFTKINPALSRYYQDYRYSLICNALMVYDFKGDYEQFSEFFLPAIPPAIIKAYMVDLCSWGLVVRQQNGRYTVTHRFIEPSSKLVEQVRRLNREWILHAADALMYLRSDHRHVSTMLLSVTPEACKAIGTKIEQLRQEIAAIVEKDTKDASCVMQLNIQYFPRSKMRNKAIKR